MQLTGRKALVTGASRGIGRAIAAELAREGCDLALCARGAEPLEALAKELRETGRTVYTQAVDVSDEQAVAGFVETAARELSGLDVVVSNVSAGSVKGPDQWRLSFQADLLAVRPDRRGGRPAPRAVRRGRDRRGRDDVGVRHPAHRRRRTPTPRSRRPCWSTRPRWGTRWPPRASGSTPSPPARFDFAGGAWDKVREGRPELYESIRARIPIGRLGRAEEVARAVTFLASPAASFCTAVNLVVDGGFVSRVQF